LKEAKHKEAHLVDLKDALEEAYRKEGSLQQQIADLQADLQEQEKVVKKLEKELANTAGLKKEFEQAKKAAIQLAEANELLMQEIDSLKKEKAGHKAQDHKAQDLKAQDLKVQDLKVQDLKVQDLKVQDQRMPGQSRRPIQKEGEKPADFAAKSWLL
jgi:septal ring factor EnvC (AmiA/AmiB activator)